MKPTDSPHPKRPRQALPIDPLIPEILSEVGPGKSVLLVASPGSGKTTRVPWALAERERLGNGGKVYVLEPRRIAAKLSAERVAEENDARIGEAVGYQFRFERKRNDRTRLVFLTEGTLLRELQSNPELRGVSALVLDEFHERHLQGDLALALARKLQRGPRPDLAIVVMSATLDTGPLEKFLPGAKRIELHAPPFPIEVEYAARESASSFGLEKDIRRALDRLFAKPDAEKFGDVLVFLPGMAEIRRAESELRSSLAGRAEVLLLHGELSREEQDRALGRSTRRKVILATNIAESSVTIPGVNTVVDAGLARIASYSHAAGLPRLETKSISRASAIQRAGRAGRTGPGRVLRLYSKGDFDSRPVQETPEILRADLAPVLLDLATLGVPDLEFFEAPVPDRIRSGWKLLADLGFVEADGEHGFRLTDWGRRAENSAFHPRITRALLEAVRLDVLDQVASALVAISEGEDLGLDALAGLRRFRVSGFQTRILDRLRDTARELARGLSTAVRPKGSGLDVETALIRSLLAGFHDRTGRRGAGSEGEILLARGATASVSQDAFWSHDEFFLVIDLQESKRSGDLRARTQARSAIPIAEDWLWEIEPLPIREEIARVFDDRKKRWVEYDLFIFHNLTLSRILRKPAGDSLAGEAGSRLEPEEWERLFQAWLEGVRKGLAEREGEFSPRVPGRNDSEAWTALKVRYRLLQSAEDFEGLLRKLLQTGFPEARSSSDFPDLETVLGGLWDPGTARRFREDVPAIVSLPGRKRVPVHYEEGSPPRIESRLQDFFGMTEGPKILKGKQKLSLHLQAPNYRAVQVTEDLAGFWERHYPAIRKELMRQYPRHKWPENPLTATPPPENERRGPRRT